MRFYTKYINLSQHSLWSTLILLGVFLGAVSPLSAQVDGEIQFEHLTTQEGLSQNIVTAIAQDKRGFIWIGTEDGLTRYDGINVEIYRADFGNPNSISDNWIRDILLDSEGHLWIATHNGLSKYNPSQNNFTQYFRDFNKPAEGQALPTNYLLTLCEYAGDIWIGTGDAGLVRFDKETGTSTQYLNNSKDRNSLPDNNVKSLFVDDSNILWVGTNNGLCRYDKRLDNFFTYKKGIIVDDEIRNYEVRSIFEDSEGTLWIGTGEIGVNYFNANRTSILNFEKDRDAPAMLTEVGINAFYEDDTRTLWIGTTQGLLYRKPDESQFNVVKNTAVNPKSLNNNDISEFFEDASRMFWVGTRGGGINTYDIHRKKFYNYKHDYQDPNSLAKDVVRAVYEDGNGILYVGLREGGMDRIDRKTGKITHFESDRSSSRALWGGTVSAIYKDSRGDLWVGSWGDGLNRYNNRFGGFEHFMADGKEGSIGDERIQAITEDENSNIWVATDGGVYQWLRQEKRFAAYRHNPKKANSLSSNTVQGQAFLFDQEGVLWIGTYDGVVNSYNPKTKQFKHFTPWEHGLPGDGVISLADQNDVLWIGTDGGGLYRLNKYTELLKGYTTANGLPSNVIYGIKPAENGQLWMSTKNGLSNFLPAKERFKNYYDYHGIQSNVFYWGAAFKSDKGEMFFGGINGLTIFHPKEIEENPYIPPVYITSFKINNKEVKLGADAEGRVLLEKSISETKEIELDYTDRYFSFSFAALNYSHPERNTYKYQMEGFDEDWRETNASNPVAPYTNLPQGNYTFKVMGANNDGVWNTMPTTIKVIMTPPWWATWWARTLGVLLLGGFAYLYYLTRLRRLQRQKIELLEQVRARTAEILEKNHALEAQQNRIVKQSQK